MKRKVRHEWHVKRAGVEPANDVGQVQIENGKGSHDARQRRRPIHFHRQREPAKDLGEGKHDARPPIHSFQARKSYLCLCDLALVGSAGPIGRLCLSLGRRGIGNGRVFFLVLFLFRFIFLPME